MVVLTGRPAGQVRWLRLQVLEEGTGPGAHDDEAFVAFTARFKFRNQAGERQKGHHTEDISERRCVTAT